MGAISGKKALVQYGGGQAASLGQWSLSADRAMFDVSSWTTGTDEWRSFVDGLAGWSGTVQGPSDLASTGQTDLRTNFLTPTTASITLELDKVAGGKLSGSCYVESFAPSANIDAAQETIFGFRGTGALSFTTTT